MKRKFRDTPHGRLAIEAAKLSEDGRHLEALEKVEAALEMRPGHPTLLVYRGSVVRDMGHTDEAEALFRSALKVDPDNVHAWTHLGMLLSSKEEFKEAAYCYERSARLEPCVQILTLLANMQIAFDPAGAVHSAQRALSYDPKWEEALEVLKAARLAIDGIKDGEQG